MDKDKILSMINPKIFARITDYSFGPNDISMAFRVFKETWTVIAPGSDMPFVLLKYVGPLNYNPVNGDGWPAQAANPGAYISNLDIYQSEDIRNPLGMAVANAPILLSNVPVLLKPGVYIPAMPMIAYCGEQWDFHHTWPDIFSKPIIFLQECNFITESNKYNITTVARIANPAITFYTPWLKTPYNPGNHYSATSIDMSFVGNNRTGVAQTAVFDVTLYKKSNGFPDTAVSTLWQDQSGAITALPASGVQTAYLRKINWSKIFVNISIAGSTPAGVLYSWD